MNLFKTLFGDVNSTTENGYTKLMAASRAGDHRRVTRLIAAGAEVNASNMFGDNTALTEAAVRGHIDCLNALLAAGAEINPGERHNRTALEAAASGGHADCVKALLAVGAAVNSNSSRDALTAAAYGGHLDCLNALLAAGADVRPRPAGHTALIAAADSGCFNCVTALIKAGSDINSISLTNQGKNALMCAATRGDVNSVKALVAAGAILNAQDKDGYTALMHAVSANREGCVIAIVAAGADMSMRSNTGRTALNIATGEFGSAAIVKVISEAEAKARDSAAAQQREAKAKRIRAESDAKAKAEAEAQKRDAEAKRIRAKAETKAKAEAEAQKREAEGNKVPEIPQVSANDEPIEAARTMSWALLGAKCEMCRGHARKVTSAPVGTSIGPQTLVCAACSARLQSEADAMALAKQRRALLHVNGASATQEIEVEIESAGIYKAAVIGKLPNPNLASGESNNIGALSLLDSTDRIPLKKGTTFGATVRQTGLAQGGHAKCRCVWQYPPPGLRNPETIKTISSDEVQIEFVFGEINAHVHTYTFDHDFEMLTGVWRLEVWNGEEKLAVKSFLVAEAEENNAQAKVRAKDEPEEAGRAIGDPCFKIIVMSVAQARGFRSFIGAVASQTGIVPNDIPGYFDTKDDVRWYTQNPWYRLPFAQLSNEILKLAAKEWGTAILEDASNEIVVKPFYTNYTSNGLMCVIRDRSLAKDRQLLHCTDSPLRFYYFCYGIAPQYKGRLVELLNSVPVPNSADIRPGDTEMTVIIEARCYDEEDVQLIDSSVKRFVDDLGGTHHRVTPHTCSKCSRTSTSKYSCPHCAENAGR